MTEGTNRTEASASSELAGLGLHLGLPELGFKHRREEARKLPVYNCLDPSVFRSPDRCDRILAECDGFCAAIPASSALGRPHPARGWPHISHSPNSTVTHISTISLQLMQMLYNLRTHFLGKLFKRYTYVRASGRPFRL